MNSYTLVVVGCQELNKTFESLKEAKNYVKEGRNEHHLNGEMYITNGIKTLKQYQSVEMPKL
nr:MAG TPA: hypothetical protein [Caudoviricetes sp.]